MPVSNPSLSWELLDTVFYRSRICYDNINWPIDSENINSNNNEFSLNNYFVSIGPFASILALYPKPSSNNYLSNKIIICSSSGNLIFTINWNFINNPICEIGWSENNELIIVLKSGKYRIYYNYEGDFEEFDIFNIINLPLNLSSNLSIIKVIFSKSGFVIQTSNNNFIYIQNNNLRNPSISTIIQFPQLVIKQDSMIIEPYHILSWNLNSIPDNSIKSLSKLKLFIFTSAGLLILNKNTPIDQLPSFKHSSLLNSISLVNISPNNNFAALYCSLSYRLYILDGNFNDLLVQHDLEKNLSSQPTSISWCSNDVVVLSYFDYISVIGPSSDSINFFTNGNSFIRGEIDGLYYLTNNQLNFFSKVSKITEDTFKIGSTSPSAILIDAIDYLDKHSPKANDHLEIIDNNLVIAVDNCIRASSEEFDLYWQKKLLRAASFGKINLDLYNPIEFVQTCDYLRILNIIRSQEIGIFLTYNQLINIGIEKLIDILLLRKLHYLCIKIVEFLNLPNFKILTNWASYKLKNSSNINDDELLSILYNKLKNSKIDWTKIAYISYIEGREKLARNLLSYEPNTLKKIEFLLDININTKGDELDYALIKANEDGDVDCIILILYELFNSMSNAEFFKKIDDKFNAIGILKNIVYQMDPNFEMLRNFMFQYDDIIGLIIYDILNEKDLTDKKKLIKLQSLTSSSKSTQYLSILLKQQIKLINLQKEDLQIKFNDLIIPNESLIKTIEKIIPIDLKYACSIASKFQINNKQLAFTILKTLSKKNDKFSELYDYATLNGGGKLIGFESFYYQLAKNGEKRQAGLYIPLCKNLTTKQIIKAYICCGMWKEAVFEASNKNEIEILKAMRDSRDGREAKIASDEIERLGK